MKKIITIICIGLFLFSNINTSFAELSQLKQENYKKQIESVYNSFNKNISWLTKEEQKNKIEIIINKIDKIQQAKLSEKNSFIIGYLWDLFKNKVESLMVEIDREKNELLEKQKKELADKQTEEIKKKRLSSDERLIWTIEITAPNYSYDKEKNLVYEIITTNNVVKWYELYKNLKTWEFETSYSTKLDNWFYNSNTKEIYVAYHRWRYEYIREDLMTFSHTFIIKWTDVYYGDSKIWIFYPNQLQIQKQDNIPLTQWCTQYWSDNSTDKIYYDKNSKFYNDILDKMKYNYNYVYFCSEDDAIKAWYKKSLN